MQFRHRGRASCRATGLADGGTGLLVIMDHVLADSIAGLAVLDTLAGRGAEAAEVGQRGGVRVGWL